MPGDCVVRQLRWCKYAIAFLIECGDRGRFTLPFIVEQRVTKAFLAIAGNDLYLVQQFVIFGVLQSSAQAAVTFVMTR